MDNVLDIIYDISRKRMVISDKDIYNIIEELIKEYNIEVINKINIIEKNELIFNKVTLGHYLDDTISIYYSRIMGFIAGNHFRSNFQIEDNLTIYETVFRINLYILFIVMHELEHAIQEQITVSGNTDNFENRLIKLENDYLTYLGQEVLEGKEYDEVTDEYSLTPLEYISYKLSYIYDYKIYRSNYFISYLERLADVNALNKILNMIESIKKEIPTLYKLHENLLLDRKLEHYDDTSVSPTVEFFNNIYGENSFDYSDMGELSLDERLKLGMPITSYEYDEKRKLLLPKKDITCKKY